MATNNTPFKPKQIYIDPNKLQVIEPKLPPLPVIAKQTTALQPLQPKGSIEQPTEEQIAGLENELAMAQTPQGNNPLFQRSPEEEELKKKSIAYFLNQLDKPVAMPRYLTIQDLFNKNADFSGVVGFNPEVGRAINSLFGTKVFGDNGKIIDLAEDLPRRKEAQMQAEQERARELQKQQTGLAKDIYGIMNSIDTEAMREDRFNRQLQQNNEQFYQSLGAKREENALDRDLRRQEFEQRQAENQEAIQRQIEQQNILNEIRQKELDLKERELALKEGKESGSEVNKDDKKQLTSNNQTIAQIEAGLKAIDENPNAYRLEHAILSPTVLNTYASWTGKSKDIETRANIDNITAVYRKWLTGAQMSDKERKDYERFLPAKGDNDQVVKSKLKAMKESIERNNEAIMSNYGQIQNIESNLPILKKGTTKNGISFEVIE